MRKHVECCVCTRCMRLRLQLVYLGEEVDAGFAVHVQVAPKRSPPACKQQVNKCNPYLAAGGRASTCKYATTERIKIAAAVHAHL